MRVVMVGDFPRKVDEMGGGVEAVTSYLANALQSLPDISLEAVTLDRWGGFARTEQHRSVPVHFVPVSTRPSRLSNWQNTRRLSRVIADLQPDVVHAHIANQYASAAERTRLPWVLTAHGIRYLEMALRPGVINRYRGWTTRREEFRLMAAATNLISISPFINDVFKAEISGKVALIDNPVDGAFFDVTPDPVSGQILYVGRLIPRKDILTLLKSFAIVRKRSPHCRLRFAGEGISGLEPTGYPLELQQFIAAEGLSDAVTFLGQLDDKRLIDEYSKASVMVVSSVLETAPMVILQAMAASVPVVSTDAGGVRHLIENGKSGAVVPIGDAERLAEELHRVIDDAELASSMALRSREIAESRFRASNIAIQTRDIYYEAAAMVKPEEREA
jgi:glycosyltransferase involved in cell wall biosynthesis